MALISPSLGKDSSMSQHDPFADYFDFIYASFNNALYLKRELAFIASQTPPQGTILDLGCGTGRHVIPLLHSGYSVIGIEQSAKLVRILKEKMRRQTLLASILTGDVRTVNFPSSIDTIILFWNSFCEMALTKDDAQKIITKTYQALKPGGAFILEQTNMEPFEAKKLEFKIEKRSMGKPSVISFKTLSFNFSTRISLSEQSVSMRQNTELIPVTKGRITQRWWKKSDLELFCRAAGFKDLKWYGGDFTAFRKESDKLILAARK